jgi:hypothetical protein
MSLLKFGDNFKVATGRISENGFQFMNHLLETSNKPPVIQYAPGALKVLKRSQ